MPDLSPFIPGEGVPRTGPLARYLPPIQHGIVTGWVERRAALERAAPGSWILDPFGACPGIAIELARAGYRVIVAANNPIHRLLIELEARPPSAKELSAAFASLADIRRGNERLEQSILSLYRTTCARCGETITASSFIWDRGGDTPTGKIYRCTNCGDEGERPCNEADKASAAQYSHKGPHWARAIERITPPNDPDRPLVEEIMEMYLPRAVYALVTLINQLDRMPTHQKPQLIALLLSVLDQGNKLWPHPTQRAHPRQLTIPARFREVNLWMALEEVVKRSQQPETRTQNPNLPYQSWPIYPPAEGGIAIFDGRFKDLTETGFPHNYPNLKISAVVSAIPRPNQAFWTLSVLWTGWLLNRESAARIKGLVRRRRYDWAWHSTALSQAFECLIKSMPQQAPFLGLIGEAEPGFLSAALLAAEYAGYSLDGLALRAETNEAQLSWKADEHLPTSHPANVQKRGIFEGETAILQYLKTRGEPASYIQIFTAALDHFIRAKAIRKEEPLSEFMGKLNHTIQQSISASRRLVHLGGTETSLETGQWWITEDTPAAHPMPTRVMPLADQVEISFIDLFRQRHTWTRRDLDQRLCQTFPGLFTPNPQWIQLCLESYAEPAGEDNCTWKLRASEQAAEREYDLIEMERLLCNLGTRLGYTPHRPDYEGTPLTWVNKNGEISYRFFILATAALGNILIANQSATSKKILVCPGSRARLLQYKLQQNSQLRQIANRGWRLVKFRHIRRLADNPAVDLRTFDQQLELDPLENTDPQLLMF